MTPKKLLNQIADEAGDSEIGKARYEGALAMYECYLDKQRKYYEEHREHNREYQRAYQQAYRLKNKGSAEQIEKEVEGIK